MGRSGGASGCAAAGPRATAHFPPPKFNPSSGPGGPDQNELAWSAHCMGLETTRNQSSELSNSTMIPRMPSMRCCPPNTIEAVVSAQRVFSTGVALMAGAFGVAHPPNRAVSHEDAPQVCLRGKTHLQSMHHKKIRPHNTIPGPKPQKTVTLHGPPEKGIATFHSPKNCGNTTSCCSEKHIALARGVCLCGLGGHNQ